MKEALQEKEKTCLHGMCGQIESQEIVRVFIHSGHPGMHIQSVSGYKHVRSTELHLNRSARTHHSTKAVGGWIICVLLR